MSGFIPQHFIEELLSRIDIVDVIQPRVALKKSGSNYSACCPFHNEKTPSFTVSHSKQFYHCFGCQASGSAISFIMNYDQMHFVDAIEMLAESIGIEVPREKSDQAVKSSRKPLFEIMQQCANNYISHLKLSPEAISYLKDRQLSGETAKKFQLGFAPDGWNNLEKTITATSKQLLALGMQIENENGRIYDRFRERIMFPIKDRRGRIIAFGGRVLDQGEPKYLNSPETELFHKGEELYGLFEARKSANELGNILIVEGYIDVIALSQHGIENAVATLGTATSRSHIETLFRVVPNLIFCFDGDRAGREAAWRALKATIPALRDGRDAHFLLLEDGEDPDTLVTNHGKKAFVALLNSALSVTDFLIDHLSFGLDLSEIGDRAKIASIASPLIKLFPESIYKDLTIKKIENVIGTTFKSDSHIPDHTFNSFAPDPRPQPGYPSNVVRNNTPAASAKLLRKGVCLVLQYPFVASHQAGKDLQFNTNSTGSQLFMRLIQICEQNPKMTTASLLEHFRETDHFSGLSKLAIHPLLPDDLEMSKEEALQMFADILQRLNRHSIKRNVHLVDPSHQTGLLSIRNKQH